MLRITFGNISGGWAQTYLDFDDTTIRVGISYLTDPFKDFAELALRVLNHESPSKVWFTDEEHDYTLICEVKDKQCSFTLNTEDDPREFATMLWKQLSLQSRNSDARSFMGYEGYPDEKVAELEKALATDTP